MSSIIAEPNKGKWLDKFLSVLGGEPNQSDSLQPTNSDIWQFWGEIKRFFQRKDLKH